MTSEGDSQVGSIILAFALKHRGRVQPVCEDIISHFASVGSACAWLVSQLRKTGVLDDILGHVSVVSLRERLVATATSKGEWEVSSHDATLKPMPGLIG